MSLPLMGVKKFLSVFQGPLAVWVIIATVKSFIVGFDVKKRGVTTT